MVCQALHSFLQDVPLVRPAIAENHGLAVESRNLVQHLHADVGVATFHANNLSQAFWYCTFVSVATGHFKTLRLLIARQQRQAVI